MLPSFRIAAYNIEWYTRLFDDNNQVISTDEASAQYNVIKKPQAKAITHVLKKIDSDLVCVIEAPHSSNSLQRSRITSLENFSTNFALRATNVMNENLY